MIDIHFEEQYTLVTTTGDMADEQLLASIETAVSENMEEGNNNFIIYLASLPSVPARWADAFRHISGMVVDSGGILVVASAPEALHDALEERDIVSVPTLEEATDYVFMEEVEKNFWNEDDDADEEE
jgi:hypothetical protein